jgi:hypothetical protein
MEWVCQRRDQFKDKDIRIINYCRLYLHVTTVSELFDPDGTCMLEHMYNCRRPPWFNPTQVVTIQSRPSYHQIQNRWKALCHHWCNGKTLRKLSHCRPYRETYADHDPTGTLSLYHFHKQQYWNLKRDEVNEETFIIKAPTDWRPGHTATPITLKLRSVKSDASRFHAPTTSLPKHHSNSPRPSSTTPYWKMENAVELEEGRKDDLGKTCTEPGRVQ